MLEPKTWSRRTFIATAACGLAAAAAAPLVRLASGSETAAASLPSDTALLPQSATLSSTVPAQSNIESAIPAPDRFRWSPPPLSLYREPNGTIATDWDASVHQYNGAGKTYYVSLSSGHNANDGLTLATAFQSVSQALQMPDVDIVYIDEGVYPRKHAFNGVTIPRSVSLIALPGKQVVLSTHDLLNWTLETGMTATYKTIRTTVGRVFDAAFIDRFGDYAELMPRQSPAEVEASPGSYHTDGTSIWVRTADSRPPDTRLRVFLAVRNANIEGAKTIYMEGIRLEGGMNPFRAANTAAAPDQLEVYAKNCTFKYASATNGLHILGVKLCMLQQCLAARNKSDGFNYHHYNGHAPSAVEVGCVGRHNGGPGAANQNGSTTHDGATIIRVNGMYYSNVGPNVADVDADTHSWNIGCVSYDSRVEAETTQNANWQNYGARNRMWLDDCVTIGSLHDLYSSSQAAIYIRNLRSGGVHRTNSATIAAY